MGFSTTQKSPNAQPQPQYMPPLTLNHNIHTSVPLQRGGSLMPPPSSLSLGPSGGGHTPLHLFHVPASQLLNSPLPIPPDETSTSSSSSVVIVEIQPPNLPRVAKRTAQPDPGLWNGIKSIGLALNPARLWRSDPSSTLSTSSSDPPSFCYHCGLSTPYVKPQEPLAGTVLPVFGPELPPGFVFPGIGVEAEPKSPAGVAPSLKGESIELQVLLNKEETGVQVPVKEIEQPKAPVEETRIQVPVKEIEQMKAPVGGEEDTHADGYTLTLEKELKELEDMKRVTGSSLKPALNKALAGRLEADKKKERQQKKRGRAYDVAERKKAYSPKQSQHGTGKKHLMQPGTVHGYERKHPHSQPLRHGGKPHTPGRLPMGVFETFEEHSSWDGPGRPGWRKTDAEDYKRYLDANPYVREAIRAGYAKPLDPAISVIYPNQLA